MYVLTAVVHIVIRTIEYLNRFQYALVAHAVHNENKYFRISKNFVTTKDEESCSNAISGSCDMFSAQCITDANKTWLSKTAEQIKTMESKKAHEL